MQVKKVKTLPNCNFCGEPAIYDAPTSLGGSWGYMCEHCSLIHTNPSAMAIGFKFEIFTPDLKNQGKVVNGLESEDMDYWDSVLIDSVRTVTCSLCKTDRRLEPDSFGFFTCEQCGCKVAIPEVPF